MYQEHIRAEALRVHGTVNIVLHYCMNVILVPSQKSLCWFVDIYLLWFFNLWQDKKFLHIRFTLDRLKLPFAHHRDIDSLNLGTYIIDHWISSLVELKVKSGFRVIHSKHLFLWTKIVQQSNLKSNLITSYLIIVFKLFFSSNTS